MTLRSERPIEVAYNNFISFGDHLISGGETFEISEKTFFFGDHIIFRTKQQHFLRLFWTLQNHNSFTFELAPGPRSALGAPVQSTLFSASCYH